MTTVGWFTSPTVVCDRIAAKDGRVFFIEFKKPGQQLIEHRVPIKNLTKNYRAIHY